MRITIFFSLFIVLFATSVPVLCQGIPGCYRPPVPRVDPRITRSPAPPPVARTVQVDVPVPCPPVGCGAPMPCTPRPCGRPACSPPPPTQPVQVRVDVVVRPEGPMPCAPQRFCCENPAVFEPIFYQAAGLVQSLIAAPLALGETFMAHPVPLPMPAPTPVPCWRPPAAACPPCFQTMPPARCMSPCPPPLRCVPPGPPVKARKFAAPVSAQRQAQNALFAR
jgi:hypothetical protein